MLEPRGALVPLVPTLSVAEIVAVAQALRPGHATVCVTTEELLALLVAPVQNGSGVPAAKIVSCVFFLIFHVAKERVR